MLRRVFMLGLAGLAISGPVAYFSGRDWVSGVTASLSSGSEENAQDETEQLLAELAESEAGLTPTAHATSPPEGAPVTDLSEVIRFDVAPAWIANRWPRVSAGLSYLPLQGFRVPLVTGTAPDDLAGALTYYFNSEHRVQRITFQGTTGDYRKLVYLLTTRYGFTRRPTNTPNVVLYEVAEEDDQARSYLWVQPATVLKSDKPAQRFTISMVLERPAEA